MGRYTINDARGLVRRLRNEARSVRSLHFGNTTREAQLYLDAARFIETNVLRPAQEKRPA